MTSICVTSVVDTVNFLPLSKPTVYTEDETPQLYNYYLRHAAAQLAHYQAVRYKLTSGRHKYNHNNFR